MIFKRSLENIFRSKTKSILFFTLIFFTSTMLSISLGVWISVNDFLNKCDENYKTIAVLEYMGTEYPDETILDEKMQKAVRDFDYSVITDNSNVLNWDRSEKAIGYVEGYYRTDLNAPYKDSAVLVISDIWDVGRNNEVGTIVTESIYSVEDNTGMLVLVENPEFQWEKKRDYLVHGEYVLGKTSYDYLKLKPFENDTAAKAGFTDWESTAILDITEQDDYLLNDGEVFQKIADTYKVINNSLIVTETSDLHSLLPFNQQELFVKYGREFSASEYKNGSSVCIVSEAFAKKMGLSVGDKIDVSIAVSENTAPFESYWVDTGFQYGNEYEIVGIVNNHRDLEHILFIPSDKGMDLTVNQIGYTIGTAVLENGTAGEFYNEISPELADRMKISIYDQGYSQVAEPFKDIRRLASIVSVACIMTVISVLALFGFSFVYRQRDVSDIMIKLGAGRKRVYGYFLYSSGLLSLAAVICGSLVSFFLSGRVTELVRNMAKGYALSDKRYSIGNLSIFKSLEFSPEMTYWLFLAFALFVLLLAWASCLIYVRQTFRVRRKKRKPIQRLRAGHTIKLRGAGLKYALASILRGGTRTLVVPVVCAISIIFLGQLSATSLSFSERLDEIGKSTEIRGHFTDINGKLTNNVVVDSFLVRDMYASGYVEDLQYSKALDFYFHGVSFKNGEPTDLEPLELPKGFAYETFMDHLRMGPDLVYTNSLFTTPEFFYSTNVEAEYMDGYDESMFLAEEQPQHLCVVSRTMMAEEGIEYGDSISVYIPDYPDYRRRFMDLKVVGSFVKEAEQSNIYCQIKGYYNSDALYDREIEAERELAFDAVDFKIKSSSETDDFKEWLDGYGISEVTDLKKYRSFLVLEDIKYNSTVDMIKQQIRYINVLFPFLYVLVGLVALIVSYLMVVNRRREYAVMRALGADKGKAFMSFFLEQAFLCIMGSAVGVAASVFAGTLLVTGFIALSAGFVLLYIGGSILSILIMSSVKVSAILKYED